MDTVILKFGGSCLDSFVKFDHCCEIIKKYSIKNKVIVVVSAMGSSTDELLLMAKKVVKTPSRPIYARELDLLISVGERISMTLLSMSLIKNKVPAASLTGSQAGIITKRINGVSTPFKLNKNRITDALDKNMVVVIAGFQGVSEDKEVTTLGRGGSDLSAFFLADKLKAKKCILFSNTEGLQSGDPNIIKLTQKIEKIGFKDLKIIKKLNIKLIDSRAIVYVQKNQIDFYLGNFRSGEVVTKYAHDYDPSHRVLFNYIPGLNKNNKENSDFEINIATDFFYGRIGRVANTLGENSVVGIYINGNKIEKSPELLKNAEMYNFDQVHKINWLVFSKAISFDRLNIIYTLISNH